MIKEEYKYFGKVIIIDKLKTTLNILEKVINSYGVDTTVVYNSQDAINSIKYNNYQLVIIDSNTPKDEANKIIKFLKNSEVFNSIPVILYSGFSLDYKVEDIYKLKFSSYITKPLKKYEIDSILNRYLNKHYTEDISSEKITAYEEFIAIYPNSGYIFKKYIENKKYTQAKELLKYLKNITIQLENKELYHIIKSIESEIDRNFVSNDLIYKLIASIKEVTSNIEEILNKIQLSA